MYLQLPEVVIAHRSFTLTVPSITLEDGEILGIFGKSGAGKTSYLKRLREWMDPRDVHYMSQFDGLFEDITIRQNIELGLAASGKTMKESGDWETKEAALLKDLEVDRHLHKYPRAMSGGQRKRAEILRSLIMRPKMLLLDEPFLGIGHLFEAICTREILERGKRGDGYTIVVSHDLDLLCSFSKQILLVDEQGIIGYMPTREPAWNPPNVRAAWTLGMENVLMPGSLNALTVSGKHFPKDKAVGCWIGSANWNQDGDSVVMFSAKDIVSTRTALKHGTLHTRIEVASSDAHEPLILVGRGVPNEDKGVMRLGMSSWTTLES